MIDAIVRKLPSLPARAFARKSSILTHGFLITVHFCALLFADIRLKIRSDTDLRLNLTQAICSVQYMHAKAPNMCGVCKLPRLLPQALHHGRPPRAARQRLTWQQPETFPPAPWTLTWHSAGAPPLGRLPRRRCQCICDPDWLRRMHALEHGLPRAGQPQAPPRDRLSRHWHLDVSCRLLLGFSPCRARAGTRLLA